MTRTKIQLQDGIKRVIFVETDATIGADIGVDLRYNGQVQSVAQLKALFGSTTAASNSLDISSILIAKGDLATRDAQVQRLGIGTAGQALTVASGMPAWGTLPAIGGGTGFSAYTAGDTLYANSTTTLAKLAIGAAGDVLRVSGGAPAWQATSTMAANPSASIGLTAVNGSASTFMRSDGAPALSQAIAPTWTGHHKWTEAGRDILDLAAAGIVIGNSTDNPPITAYIPSAGGFGLSLIATSTPGIGFVGSSGGIDAKRSRFYMGATSGAFELLNDAVSASTVVFAWGRSGYGLTYFQLAAPTVSLRFPQGVWHTSQGDSTERLYFLQGGATYYRANGAGASESHVFRNAADGDLVCMYGGGAIRFNTYGAGVLNTDASGNITAVSDERLKDAIRPFPRGIEAILPLRPILHGYTEASGLDRTRKDYAGFSAQNVERAIPEAVGRDPRGFRTFNDRPVLAAVVNAMQEMYARLVALENRS